MFAIIRGLLGEFGMSYNVLPDNGGKKYGSQMMAPVGNRRYSSDMEDREIDRNLTWLNIPCMLAGGGNIAGCDVSGWWGWICQNRSNQDLHLSPSLSGVCSILGIGHSIGPSYSRKMGSQPKVSSSPSSRGTK